MSGRRWLSGLLPDAAVERHARREPALDGSDPDAALTAAIEVLGGAVMTTAGASLPRLAEALVARAHERRRAGRLLHAAADIDRAIRVWGFLAGELDGLPEGVAAAAGLPSTGAVAEAAAGALRGSLDGAPESWLPGLVLGLVERSAVESAQGRAAAAMVSAEAALERAEWLVESWSDDCDLHLGAALGALADRAEEVGNLTGSEERRDGQIAALERAGDAGALGGAWSRRAQLALRRGDPDGATQAFGQAAAHYAPLVEESPERWGVARAMALENRVAVAEQQRDVPAAAAAAQTAADAWRALGEVGRARYACCLSRLADAHTELGQREEALDVAQQAARIAADIPEPALSLEDRIWILNAWSRALSDLDRRVDALEVSREQVRLLRVQEAQQGGAPHPQLALSLVNLAIDLKQLGRGDEALATAREGAARMRTLAEDDPALQSDLAAALVELSNCSSWLGRIEDALTQVQEARQLYTDLDARSPGAFDSDRVMTLANEGGLWWRRGEHRRAVELMERAAALCRPMARAAPQQHGPMLATLLANLAGALADDDQPAVSLAAVEESVAVHRALAERLPGAFLRGLALALNNLGGSLFEMDRFDDALAAFDEAAGALERAGTECYEGAAAELQSNRAACLLEQGAPEAALAPAEHGVTRLRIEFAERPDATRAAFSRVLAVRGTARVRAGDPARGLHDLEEALDLLAEALRRAPAATTELWEWVGERYVEACAAVKVSPDAKRLSAGMDAT